MNGYDWGWNREYGRGFGMDRLGGGYDAEYSSWGDAWGRPGGYGFNARAMEGYRGRSEFRGMGGSNRGFGGPGRGGYDLGYGGYDRGIYGESYPTYGGYPGGRSRGLYYGGRGEIGYGGYSGYGGDYQRQGGRGDAWGRGYDRGFARERFLPEEAYTRHPELNRPQRHSGDRWPASGHDQPAWGDDLSDEEILQGVRESLYHDNYVDANQIEVEVNDRVVTLRGEVDDYLEARYAWDDAWESAGVRGVINQLTVRTDQPQEHGDVLPQTAGGQAGTTTARGRGKKST